MPPQQEPALSPALRDRALGGDAEAVRILVDALLPVVHRRVAGALARWRGAARGRDLQQEVDDMAQEVFASLYENDGRALRAWDPARGLPLERYVGLLAGQQVTQILRSGRRSPWTEDPTLDAGLERQAGPSPDRLEARVYSREVLAVLLTHLRMRLSPRGFALFEAFFIQQRSVAEVGAEFEMSADAIYAWRSRLKRLVTQLAEEIESEKPGPTHKPSHGDPAQQKQQAEGLP